MVHLPAAVRGDRMGGRGYDSKRYDENGFARAFGGDGGTCEAGKDAPPDRDFTGPPFPLSQEIFLAN